MPKCPKCEAEIDHLINVCSAWKLYRFRADGSYEHIDDISGDTSEYECPECHEVLFVDELEAQKFLKAK
jgi:hypothetical protein